MVTRAANISWTKGNQNNFSNFGVTCLIVIGTGMYTVTAYSNRTGGKCHMGKTT